MGNNPPVDVIARVIDNDDITEQGDSAIDGCRATQLFHYADSTGRSTGQQDTAVPGRGVFKKEWLTDYNCDSGDAGGLPGYPLSPTRSDGVSIDGYCTDGVSTSQSVCIAQYFCTVAGSCNAPASAATQEECGVCSTVSGQPTATDRFTQTECIKDSDGDDAADGTWAAATWSTSDATEANCASVLGGVWKARTWVPAPLGDATTGWLPVKAAGGSVVATAHAYATKTFTTGDISALGPAVGDRVTVGAATSKVCGTASADCTICGTYHIAEVNGDAVVFLEAFTSQLAGDAAA